MRIDQAVRELEQWQELHESNLLPWMKEFSLWCEQILPAELERGDDDECPIDQRPQRLREVSLDLLVAIVGLSPQPIALTIAVQKPQRIRLIGTTGSLDYMEQVERWAMSCGRDVEPRMQVDEDSMADVVAKVRDAVIPAQTQGKRVVVDITGGRKTMVSAAFLLASERQIDVTYVHGRQVEGGIVQPGTSVVHLLDDPAAALALREQRRAFALCEREDFRAAGWLFAQIAQDHGDPALAQKLGLSVEKWENAASECRALAGWVEGRYEEAAEVKGVIPKPIRPIVIRWGDWKAKEGGAATALRSTTGAGFLLLADRYHAITRAWTKKLPFGHPATTYLKAFALGELAMEIALEAMCRADRVNTVFTLKKAKDISTALGTKGSALLFALGEVVAGSDVSGLIDGEVPFGGAKVDITEFKFGGSHASLERIRLPMSGTLEPHIKPWILDEPGRLRNTIAHGIGMPSTEQVDWILGKLKGLLLGLADLVGQGKDANGNMTDLAVQMPEWLDEPSAFAPPTALQLARRWNLG